MRETTWPRQGNGLARWIGPHWHWLLVVLPLPLFTTSQYYHFPMGAMALIGVVWLVRDPQLRSDPAVRFLFWAFVALWLPQLLALPDAVHRGWSLRTALVYAALPLSAVYMVRALGPGRDWIRVAAGLAVIQVIWAFDVIPGVTGLVTWPAADDPRLIPGAWFARYSVAHTAAPLSPILFEMVRREYRTRPWLLVFPLILSTIVLLSGRRVAWMMFFLSTAAYAVHLVRHAGVRPSRIAAVALMPAAAGLLIASLHGGMRTRVNLTLDLFSRDVEVVDVATSWRLDIWRTSLRVFAANPINGIGTRAFYDVYGEYAAEDDFWLQEGRTGAHHPHLFLLEVAAETGVLGVIGYGVALWLLWRLLRKVPPERRGWAWPCGIAAAVALFPFNAHTAFYSSFWSSISWWFLGMAAAAMGGAAARSEAGPRAEPVSVAATG